MHPYSLVGLLVGALGALVRVKASAPPLIAMVTITAKSANGTLRGRIEDGMTVFRGVRYAECERFGAPGPVPVWDGEADSAADGPIAPQRPSRLEPVMGVPERSEQAEDCLTLTLTTPGADHKTRPVLVWFHGGAWVSGAGSWKWYGGHRLARDGDIVVVSVNYRLGVLGYLRAAGVCGGNLGLADQLAALRWVRDNIAAFGGDPEAVTVAGQSAGGHSVQCLLGMPAAEGLFRRAIVQSAPGGLGLGQADVARRSAKRFIAQLGGDPGTAPVEAILDAQAAVARQAAGRLGLDSAPQFMPVAGAGPLPDEAGWATCLTRRAPGLDVIVGTTGREMGAFYALNPVFRRTRRTPVLGSMLANGAERAVGTAGFYRPARRLATRLSAAGARVWTYRFDYAAPASPFGACHCIELPFLLGAETDWASAPMLAGADPRDIDTLGRRLRTCWLGFIRTGTPTTDTPWRQYTAHSPATHHWNA